MKPFLIILILLIAIILQTTAAPFLSISGNSPNLILVLVLILVTFKDFKEIWWVIVLASLFLELFSGLMFGLISLSLICAVYLIDWINKNFSATKLWMKTVFIGSGILLYNLLLIVLGRLFHLDLFFSLKYLFINIIYNLLIMIIFFSLVYGAKKVFYQE